MRICLDSPIPSVDAVIKMFLDRIPFPPYLPLIPLLPTLPNPIFEGFRLPNLEMIVLAFELQAFQLQNTLLAMVKPMLDLLGMDLLAWLPKIPGLPFSLADLLALSPQKIIDAVKEAIMRGFRWPGIPWPLFPRFSLPIMEVVQMAQMIISQYMQLIATMITDLIKKVTDKLKIPGFTFPKLPTPEELLQMILSLIPGIPDLDALIEKYRDKMDELIAMLSSLTFPGFPSLPMLPWPLIPNFRLPDFEFKQAMLALMNNLATGLMNIIMKFIEDTLKKFLSFTFPKICIEI